MKKENMFHKAIDCEKSKELAQLHEKIFDPTPLRDHLIYYDQNFENYLLYLLRNSKKDLFMGIYEELKLEGFIHLKELENSVFLNNLFLGESFRGKGLGKNFLLTTLNEFSLLYPKEFFDLDVFSSNKIAKEWYGKLGMKENGKRYWYKYFPSIGSVKSTAAPIRRERDLNGFTSYFFESTKLATLINYTTLIVHGVKHLEFFRNSDIENIIVVNPTQLKKEKVELIDISIRMRGHLNEVLNNLK